MKCPKCGSTNISVQIISETQLKEQHHGIFWWLVAAGDHAAHIIVYSAAEDRPEDDPQEDGGLPELRKKLAGITAVFCDQ